MNLIELNDLSKFDNRGEIIKQTALQIIKDFSFSDLEIVFSGDEQTVYQELYQQIQPIVFDLLNSNKQKLMSVLYRIDLSEILIHKASSKQPQKDLSEIISELIIKRELQKVVIRNYYSSKNSGRVK